MSISLGGRKVEVESINFARDVVDCFIEKAYFVDNGKELNDDELDLLAADNYDYMYERWFDHRMGYDRDWDMER